MSANLEHVEIIKGGEDLIEKHSNDLMEMFNVLSFREKWRHVWVGLKQPIRSGAHKWAKLQILRLLSPVAALVVPLLVLAVIMLIPKPVETEEFYEVRFVDPKPLDVDVFKDKAEPIIEKEQLFDPIMVDFKTPDIAQPPVDIVAPPKEVTLQKSDINSIAQTKGYIQMKNMIGHRTPGARATQLAKFNASETDIGVLHALRYLKKNQNYDGSWGKNKVAMTSLALLAYLAHGELPASDEFGPTVQAAIEYILAAQQSDGHFSGRDGHDYTHPIATYALAEAYAMTRIPKIKEATVKAMRPIIKGQNASGGFNYNLLPSSRDDSSYMAWCIQALKAAKMAGLYGDLPGLKECMSRSVSGFRKNYGECDGYGGFGYASKGNRNSGLTGAGVLCLQFLGASNTKECKGGLKGLSDWEFNWEKPKSGSFVYYMYYTTQAKFQEGGRSWQMWDNQFKPSLIRHQNVISKKESGYIDHNGVAYAIGSWISPAKQELNGGDSIMDTILCTLMLEVYTRYLPTFMVVPEDHQIKDEIGDSRDEVDIDFG